MDNYSFNGENEAPAASPVAAPAAPKKQGGKILAIAFIAMLVGGAIASAIFITIGNQNKGGDNKSSSSKTATETTTLDARLTAELAYKTNRIVANTSSSERGLAMDTTGKFSDYSNLTDQKRADIVIGSKFIEEGPIAEKMDVSKISDSYKHKQAAIDNGYKQLTVIRVDDRIKNEYKYLFDKELTDLPETVITDTVSGCPMTLVKDQSLYVQSWGCGGASPVSHSMYQYKYELDGEKAYVYYAVMAEYDDGTTLSFYSGYYGDSKLLSLTNDQKTSLQGQGVKSGLYNPTTDDYDYVYKKVQHYRAVFEKGSDGDFYYKTIEKVND